jgi:hypothetical protein
MVEYTFIMQNGVWDIVPYMEGKLVMISKWLYKIKHAVDGIIEKFKARFVARGSGLRGDVCSSFQVHFP